MPADFLSQRQSHNPPAKLWRVQRDDSEAKFYNRVLLPAIRLTGEITLQAFHARVDAHLRWFKDPSPFLSVFDDRPDAIQWGKDRLMSGSTNVKLYEIDSREVGDVMIFRVDDLRRELGIPLARDTSHEYLILNGIPRSAMRLAGDVQELLAQSYLEHMRILMGDRMADMKPLPRVL